MKVVGFFNFYNFHEDKFYRFGLDFKMKVNFGKLYRNCENPVQDLPKLTQKMHVFAVTLQMDIVKLFQRQFPIVNKFISLVLKFSVFRSKQKGFLHWKIGFYSKKIRFSNLS